MPIYAMKCPNGHESTVFGDDPPPDGLFECRECGEPTKRDWSAAPSIGRGSSREPFRASK